MLPAPALLALGLVLALIILIPARRLQLAGLSSRIVGSYVLVLWLLAMFVAIRPIGARILVPILLVAYLAPFVAAPDRVGRILTRGRGGPGSDGRPVKDVTPPDQPRDP